MCVRRDSRERTRRSRQVRRLLAVRATHFDLMLSAEVPCRGDVTWWRCKSELMPSFPYFTTRLTKPEDVERDLHEATTKM